MRYTLILFFACTLALFGAGTNYFGTILLTDGIGIIPNVAIPTPAEVLLARSEASSAKQGADAATLALDALTDAAAKLQVQTDALNGTAIMYTSCTTFGSQAVESSTNATVRMLNINLTSNAVDMLYVDIYTRFSEAPAGMPTVQHSVSLAGGGATEWVSLPDLGSVITTFPIDGVDVECYRNTVAVPAANASGFFRVKGTAQQTVIGQFLIIYHGFTVNGVQGKTMFVEGFGQFISGLLCDPIVEGQSL